MKYELNPGTAIFAPLSENVGKLVLTLAASASFGQVGGVDSVMVDAESEPLSPKRERGLGCGFLEVSGGNLLLLGNTKKAYIVEGFSSSNITSPTLQKVKLDGTKENVTTFPAAFAPGEHVAVGGSASDADNFLIINARLRNQGDS